MAKKTASSKKGTKSPKSETTETSQQAEATTPTLPLFYRQPAAISSEKHSGLKLTRGLDYSFARERNSLPVNLAEFLFAQSCYPIVFSQDEIPVPTVMLGQTGGPNLFIDDKGEWMKEQYVPSYIRRYPFIMVPAPNQTDHLLCIDLADERLTEDPGTDGEAFYVDGKATAIMDRAADFCAKYHQEHLASRSFSEAVKDKGLFQPGGIKLSTSSGDSINIGGYQVINDKAFNELDDETFLDWRRKGWIAAVYAHLFSIGNWRRVGNRIIESAQAD